MIASDVRRYVEAALGKLTPGKAQEIARSMVQGQGKEQVQKFAKDLMEWSSKNRERMVEFVRREVRAQLKLMGVASRDELEALKKRVRELERAATKPSAVKKRTATKRPATKAPATKAPATKRAAAAKRSGAKRSTAKRSTTEKPG
jgi:polyhydroxyalkanoate synthesis regulator phasin